jgi:hypothetical protein
MTITSTPRPGATGGDRDLSPGDGGHVRRVCAPIGRLNLSVAAVLNAISATGGLARPASADDRKDLKSTGG